MDTRMKNTNAKIYGNYSEYFSYFAVFTPPSVPNTEILCCYFFHYKIEQFTLSILIFPENN